jgi:D-3-phosphoglycerate dehydrogenase
MASKTCLIIDSMHESIFNLLVQIGWQYVYMPDIARAEIKEKINGFDGLIVRSKTFIDRDLLGENPTLKFVGRAGAGIDNLDLKYLQEKNIAVLHAAEGNRDAVGEFTVGLLLGLMRNIPRADVQVKKSTWDREGNRGEEIAGKTVALIGYGNMGRAFAQRLSGFGCKVLAYDKYKTGFTDNFCAESDMQSVFAEADILSLHIPLTDETKGMANTEYFNRFRKNIVLLNTARGEIIPFIDLENVIKSGKVKAAALDVLENEKLSTLTPQQRQSFNYLASTTNVIFTPHIAGWTFQSHEKINVALVDKIKALGLT